MTQKNATLIVLDHPQDFRNIIQGATVFSSGGGGSKKLGALVVAARGSLSDHFSQTDDPKTPEEAETFITDTMDNSLPTLDSPEYTEPIHYWAEMGGTLRVIAWDLTQDNTGTYKYFSREATAPLPCSPW